MTEHDDENWWRKSFRPGMMPNSKGIDMKKAKCALLTSLVGVLLIGGGTEVFAAGTTPGRNDQMSISMSEVDSIMNQALQAFRVPGAAIAIVIDGKVVAAKGYGLRDQEKNLPVTENTVFGIGSCTKAFTALLLGQLVDEGAIAWDDPVIKHLPEFRLKDLHTTHHVTIRDLAAHRTGVARHDFAWYNTKVPRSELLARLQHFESAHGLREKFHYNNLMYGVAGLVIEKVTGKTWEQAVQERILRPLGMNHSNLSVEESQKSNDFSLPYAELDEAICAIPFRNVDVMAPAGAINASIADMAKWLQFQLADSQSLVQKGTLQEMHSLQTPFSAYPAESIYSSGYGLGWLIGIHKGHYSVSHGGGIDGFISQVSLLPQDKVGVVVLTNNSNGGAFLTAAVTNAVLDRLIEKKEEDWVAKLGTMYEQQKAMALKSSEETAVAGSSPAFPLREYVGEYEHPGYGTVKVVLENGQLSILYNGLTIALTHKLYDSFTGSLQCPAAEQKWDHAFSRNLSGEIAELQIPFDASVNPIAFKRKPGSDLLAHDYLKQFQGLFEMEGVSIDVRFNGNQLLAVMPGHPGFELIPNKPFLFSLKGLAGYSARFVQGPDGKITEMSCMEPSGTYTLKKKP